MLTQHFPSTQRLLTSRAFSAVFNNATVKIHTPYFLILAIDNLSDYPRLGCIVAKKHAKKAVERNRIKRIIKETFRLNKNKLLAYDVVVMTKPNTTKQNNQILHHELALVWQKPILIKS